MGTKSGSKRGFTFGQVLIKFRTLIILAVLVIIFTSFNGVFINSKNLLNMLKQMSYTVIAGFGATFALTLGGMDLSIGSLTAVVGVGFALLVKGNFMPVLPALLIILIASLIMGLFNGFVTVKGKIEPFLVTLATMNIFRGIALVLSNGKPVPIVVNGFADFFGNGLIFNLIPSPVVISIVFFLLSWFLFRKTKYGFYVRCIGGNVEAARVAGIKVDTIKISTYVLSSFYGYISGLILSSLMNSGMPDIGKDLAMDALAGAVLGGTAISGGYGTILGTVGGCLIIAALNNGMALLGAQYSEQILVKGIVIILAVLMDNALKSRKKA